MDKLLKPLGIFVGIFLILNTVLVSFFSVFSFGNLLPAIVGITILLYSVFYNQINCFCKNGLLKFLHNFFKLGLFFFVFTFIICTAIVYKNSVKEPPLNANAVIVLGAGLRGEQVSLSLAHRLDAAKNYYLQNKDVIIIVSGGQGKNELVTEASAMKKYLVSAGVPKEVIIEEDKSSRTLENFRFSKVILDDIFKSENYSIVYTTNGFHIFRAGMIAKQEGLNAYGLNAESVSFLAPTQYLREYFSILKFLALDYK